VSPDMRVIMKEKCGGTSPTCEFIEFF
jgi:hypothetical protein